MEDGWIKLHRKMREWQHYQCPSVRLVFEELLFCVNTKPKWFKGIMVGFGQTLVSISTLSEYTGFDRKTVVGALKKLIESGEIKREKAGFYMKTTVLNFEKYQKGEWNISTDPPTDPPTGEWNISTDTPTDPSTGTRINKNEEEVLALASEGARAHTREEQKSREEERKKKYQSFIGWLAKECPYVFSHIEPPTPEQFFNLKKTYTSQEIADCCLQIENRTDLRKKYKNLYRTLLNWLKRERRQRNGRPTRETVEERNRRIIEETAAVIASRQAEDDRNR